MADYTTKAVTVGGVTLTISKEVGTSAGERLEAFLYFLAKWAHAGKPPEGEIDNSLPDTGKPPSVPGRPGQDLPGAQPEPGHPLPGDQPQPGNPLPGDQPSVDNDLPHWLGENAIDIAKAVLKGCFECDTAKPHHK